ncbi:sorbosone dehydrogenase family protein [Paraferrimonas sp. SM1919]|uniref:PQQ-dependent sugar dehydrogenase n=1 Tax=Paraferrimonas sp. SM1919 TaxID=2662263 RepID=UPI001F09D906|nr:PQQ-dependent sugar dehydrogenase [Paraferrimonas sp. SM1919]
MPWIGIICAILCFSVHAREQVKVAKGLKVELYAAGLKGAEHIAVGPTGLVFASAPEAGVIHALIDFNNDGRIERKITLSKGLSFPQGMTFIGNDLYVLNSNKLLKFAEIESRLNKKLRPQIVLDNLPQNQNVNYSRILKLGPDNWLYATISSGCNVCQPQQLHGSIIKINPVNNEVKQIAAGIRNAGGIDWSPLGQQLWFSDNSRDWLGDNVPADEVNRISFQGEHFGFPYRHAGNIEEKSYVKPARLQITQPAFLLPAHVAPAGILFYEGEMLPKPFQGSLLIAERGSRYRSSKVGYQVTSLRFNGQGIPINRSTFVSFLDGEFPTASPSDIAQLTDGSVLISDRLKNKIYRITHHKDDVADRENKL